jgi:hypothetical protein
MGKKLKTRVAIGGLLLGSVSLISVGAYAKGHSHHHRPHIDHILLISIDGMHALDFANCASGLGGVNGGNPY